ncbi:MAG: YggT family protein [Atopobiaceae bacterium]|nr:YggT family protein [Atopobiaceae bacterium]
MRLMFVLYRLIDFYELLILAECILSWFPVGGIVGDIYQALQRIVDPFVDIFRRLIPSVGGSGMRLDFSPMIAIIALDLVKRLIIGL